MTDIVLRENDDVAIVDEQTGEVIALVDASREVIAQGLRDIELRLNALVDLKRVLADALITRMDANASWTTAARGVKVTAPRPTRGQWDWDGADLAAILDDLVNEGVITLDAKLAACQPRTEFKVLLRGVDALMAIPGVAERILPARREAPEKPRRVKVEVKRGGE